MPMIRVLALCILALPAVAQQDGQLSLGGTVINAKTGAPLPRALVNLMHFGDPKLHVQQWNGFTDSAGRFLFPGLPAGQYSITPRKPEFTSQSDMPGEYSVDLTASTQSVRVKLWPLGVITGKIVDQDGLPALGVIVNVLSTQIQGGLLQAISDQNVTTDDRGVYRLWNLQPGRYYIKVAGSGNGTFLTPANANTGLADESIAAVYFGGGKTLDSATPVEIALGSEAHADLSLSFEPAFKIRGAVVNFVQRRNVKFELLSGSDEVQAVGASVNNDTGKFELAAVVAGSYVLRATQDGNTAEAPVTVRSADVDGVSLVLTPPVDIPVVTSFAGKAPGGQPAGCVTQLRPSGRLNALAALTRVAEKDLIRGVAPGRYRVSFQCVGGYARSAISGTHDLAADPILNVEPGVSPPPIVVTVYPGGGGIKGTLAFDGPIAAIVLVPQFSSVAGPQMIVAGHRSGGSRLEFQTDHLPPGSYVVMAFARQDIEYRNPEFLRALSGGVVVQIDDDAEKQITLDGVVQ